MNHRNRLGRPILDHSRRFRFPSPRSRAGAAWACLLTAASLFAAPTPATQAPVPLVDTLGSYSRPIHTEVELAQAYFDQGVGFTFGYYFPEAVASFREAIRHDPRCAMCHWGLALAISPNPNSRRFASIVDDPQGAGRAAIARAVELATDGPEVERAFVEALAVRFAVDRYPDRGQRDAAYIEATRRLSERYPQDPEAATMLADAIMTASPWEYWRPDGSPRPDVSEAKAALERAVELVTDHPWANHLYIHLMENSQTPQLALPHADRLEATMPVEGHMVHMPAHIYIRVGDYERVTASNRRSLAADQQLAELWGDAELPLGVATYGLSMRTHPGHAHDFLHAAAMMQGNYENAIRAAEALAAGLSLDAIAPDNGAAQGRYVKGWLTQRRFGKWDELLARALPETELPFVRGMFHYARGGALVATGKLAEAQEALDRLAEQAVDPSIAELPARRNLAPVLLALAAEVLRGEIAAARGHTAAALNHLDTAVRIEDRLLYVEPADWQIPTRHTLGALLLEQGRYVEAEAVYWEDLRRFPHNGWSLLGLALSLEGQGKTAEAADARRRFEAAWSAADTPISGSLASTAGPTR